MAVFSLLWLTLQVPWGRPKTQHPFGPRGGSAVLPHFSNDISPPTSEQKEPVWYLRIARRPALHCGISAVKEMLGCQGPTMFHEGISLRLICSKDCRLCGFPQGNAFLHLCRASAAISPRPSRAIQLPRCLFLM